jgi:hypothetical protein
VQAPVRLSIYASYARRPAITNPIVSVDKAIHHVYPLWVGDRIRKHDQLMLRDADSLLARLQPPSNQVGIERQEVI